MQMCYLICKNVVIHQPVGICHFFSRTSRSAVTNYLPQGIDIKYANELLNMQKFHILPTWVGTHVECQPYAGFRLTCRSPLCRYLRRLASLAVSELQLSAATPLWLLTERQSPPSWIEFNCLRSAAVGKAARLSIYWLDAACRLVIPLRQVTLAQLN